MSTKRKFLFFVKRLTKRKVDGSYKVKKEEKKPKVESASTHVTLKVQGQDEEGHRVFRVKRKGKLLKMMEHYNEMRGVKWDTFVFLLDGRRIQGHHTPDELELKDGDEIDALFHQGGGSGLSAVTFRV